MLLITDVTFLTLRASCIKGKLILLVYLKNNQLSLLLCNYLHKFNNVKKEKLRVNSADFNATGSFISKLINKTLLLRKISQRLFGTKGKGMS